ncbi:Endonuclease/exonuclease/phosphatase [Penicillium herquei]|nr:Endonuclease/exonuclease/phosphatase [Penicillium herquei]
MEDLYIYILTSNCARTIIDVDLFADHFFDALSTEAREGQGAPELIVLSLQEIAPIAYSFLGGTYLTPYFDAFVKTVKKATANLWNESYVNLVKDHTGMTGLMVFARADIMNKITWVDTAHVGFGVQEMGNKGAVGARLGYVAEGHPSKTIDLTFVAAHLAPMENALAQRNLDWRSIVERLVFSHGSTTPKSLEQSGSDENAALLADHESSHHSAGSSKDIFSPNSYLFLAGDLNYRTSSISPIQGDLVRFPRQGVPRDDPAHYSHLLKEDQLMREMGQGRCFHGLSEAAIDFPPTYKYSGAAQKAARVSLMEGKTEAEWKWSTHRWPSWCDRILYWAGDIEQVKPLAYNALPLFPHSDHRPVALAVSVPLELLDAPSETDHAVPKAKTVAPFAIDPAWQARRDAARRKEILVGLLAYLSLTWEGNGLLLASTVGLLGAWFVLQSLWAV